MPTVLRRAVTPASAVKRTPGVRGVVPPGDITRRPLALRSQCGGRRCLVGEEGFEPSHPFGHTDLNRARLPFRHSPEWDDLG